MAAPLDVIFLVQCIDFASSFSMPVVLQGNPRSGSTLVILLVPFCFLSASFLDQLFDGGG
jgi:hypothetical protein